jgi:DNA segregation ATPase FtsK/SpoIIIE, S-DNA-T family
MEIVKNFNKILQSFNIKAECINYKCIDNYFYYDVKLLPKARVKDISKYGDEISLALKTPCKPGINIMHDQGHIRLEFASPRVEKLNLFDYFTNVNVPKGTLTCLLGQTVAGERLWMDLANNPHMIVAGTTGSGKSTLMHNIIANLLNYNNAIIHLMDPKNIEFSDYDDYNIKNISVSYTYSECVFVLDSLIELMDSRYDLIRSGTDMSQLPPVVVIIDEFADLILQDKDDQFYLKLLRLAQKCRAAKIHIILGTQRPSVNIINGSIKANFPARISCKVTSHIDSKIVLDAIGAENLLGNGDALIRDNLRSLDRFQVAYTNASEVCSYFSN